MKANNVLYVGGIEALKKDIYANLKYEYEDNVRDLVFILFDKKLKMKEVRLCELTPKYMRLKEKCKKGNYCKDYIHSIRQTKKKWTSKEKGYHVAIFSIQIH